MLAATQWFLAGGYWRVATGGWLIGRALSLVAFVHKFEQAADGLGGT